MRIVFHPIEFIALSKIMLEREKKWGMKWYGIATLIMAWVP